MIGFRLKRAFSLIIVSTLAACGYPNIPDSDVLNITDTYVKKRDPQLIHDFPIRSIDQNDDYWIVYYLPDKNYFAKHPDKSMLEPMVGGDGFVVNVNKKSKMPENLLFQQ
ncbi:hypothetical protein FFK22_025335 [Mycobacterium sp. KBS0706]|uniref:hypothetical protein n=1 Tax=Mycobacterium sp. KBS0706 TaxID=2578109 RepID=UPI00110FB239|nr:hypothetical protein [Mycobacterium sp. KBS0706]TSD85814.1 hypothetical protein FFK22_025335 [Mycobacterium sp. KBS0706]